MDEKISDIGVISGKRTTFNALQSRKKAYDPYGVAKIPLIDLLKGQSNINLRVSTLEFLKRPEGNRCVFYVFQKKKKKHFDFFRNARRCELHEVSRQEAICLQYEDEKRFLQTVLSILSL